MVIAMIPKKENPLEMPFGRQRNYEYRTKTNQYLSGRSEREYENKDAKLLNVPESLSAR